MAERLYRNEAWLREQYIGNKRTLEDLARDAECGRQTISNWLHIHNIPTRQTSEAQIGDLVQYRNRDFLLKSYIIEKKSLIEIADLVGCGQTTIERWMNEFEIERRSISECLAGIKLSPERVERIRLGHVRKNALYADRAWIEHQYVDLKLSSYEIADLADTDAKTIWNWLHHFNIPRRSIGETRMGDDNPMRLPEVKAKISGSNHPFWRGGVSKKYCAKWTEELRESIRDEFGRKCFLCPTTEKKNKRKLSVHHINFDKKSECFGKRWNLLPLCTRCHIWTTRYRHEAFALLSNYWAEKYIENGINI